MYKTLYKVSGVVLLVVGLFLLNNSILFSTTIDVWVKRIMLALFNISGVIQLYYFLFSSYRGNFMYWMTMAIYCISGAIVFVLTKINGNYAMVALFIFYLISIIPSVNVQIQMRKEPPPEDFFTKYFN